MRLLCFRARRAGSRPFLDGFEISSRLPVARCRARTSLLSTSPLFRRGCYHRSAPGCTAPARIGRAHGGAMCLSYPLVSAN